MWDLLGPGVEPVSPELAGRFSAAGLPGKSQLTIDWYDGASIAGVQDASSEKNLFQSC